MKCPLCKQEMQPIRAYAEGGYRCEHGACGIQYVGLTFGDIDKITAALVAAERSGFEQCRERAENIILRSEYPLLPFSTMGKCYSDIRALEYQEPTL